MIVSFLLYPALDIWRLINPLDSALPLLFGEGEGVSAPGPINDELQHNYLVVDNFHRDLKIIDYLPISSAWSLPPPIFTGKSKENKQLKKE